MQVPFRVRVDLLGGTPPYGELVREVQREIQGVDDRGHERGDPLIHRAGKPGRPTSLRSAQDRECLEWHVPLHGGDLAGRIHRSHGTLDHGQQEGPVGLPRAQVLVEGVRDDPILGSIEERLIGHLSQHGHHGPQAFGDSYEQACVVREFLSDFGLITVPPTPAGNDQQAVIFVLYPARFDDIELMLPENVAPRL